MLEAICSIPSTEKKEEENEGREGGREEGREGGRKGETIYLSVIMGPPTTFITFALTERKKLFCSPGYHLIFSTESFETLPDYSPNTQISKSIISKTNYLNISDGESPPIWEDIHKQRRARLTTLLLTHCCV
jgi:hypothetical protein